MMNSRHIHSRGSAAFAMNRRQAGAALVVGLIFLVILTLLGLTAMQTGILEERMAGNSRDRNIAFQGAEAGLRDAEHDARCQQFGGTAATVKRPIGCISGMTGATSTCTNGLCCTLSTSGLACVEPSTPVYTTFTGAVTYGAYTSAAAWPTTTSAPQYLIEPFNFQGSTYFRISARGYGVNSSTVVVLQEVYKE
jgi:type IV pilus assembly protein PilX